MLFHPPRFRFLPKSIFFLRENIARRKFVAVGSRSIRRRSPFVDIRRVEGVGRGGIAGARVARRSVDYRNVCFPSERLFQPNDAFGTRVRAPFHPSLSLIPPPSPPPPWTTHEQGRGIVHRSLPLATGINWLMIASSPRPSPRHSIWPTFPSLYMGRIHRRHASLGRVPRERNFVSADFPRGEERRRRGEKNIYI